MKKSSFSACEYLEQCPADGDIRKTDGIADIPIAALEKALDFFEWGTRHFEWDLHKDGQGMFCVAASLELVLSYIDEDGQRMTRCFVGACNFSLASIAPIPHWLATAKSLCIKNAASDAGRRFGRDLNVDVLPVREERNTGKTERPKMKPDAKIMQEYIDAVRAGDNGKIAQLAAIYDIKIEKQ